MVLYFKFSTKFSHGGHGGHGSFAEIIVKYILWVRTKQIAIFYDVIFYSSPCDHFTWNRK